jgi:colicin import membrane protein
MLDGTGLTPQPAGISVDSQERGSLTDRPMWKELRNNPRALLYAVLMHLLLFLALILNLDWKTTAPSDAGQSGVIKAQVVDNAKVQAEVNKLKQAEANKVHQEETRKNELESAAQQAEQRLSEVKEKQVEEQQNLQKLEQQRIAQQKLEIDRQSKLKIQQAEAAKQTKQKQEQQAKAAQQRTAAEEEKKRTAAAEAKRKQEEAKQKAAEDKKRQASADTKQQQADERAMKQQLADEERASQMSGQNSDIVSKYKTAIQQAIYNSWQPPPSAPPGMQCEVRVRIMPGGGVIGVRFSVSSGDAVFDNSVESAVYKAVPLPLPPDPGLFDNFRDLKLTFKKPEN